MSPDSSGAVSALRYLQDPMAELTAISLFSGAGGLDLGAEAAGFATCAAVESSDVARRTMLANAPRHFPRISETAVLSDVLLVEPKELLGRAQMRRGEVDLLVGGPPCTPFSKSGYWLEYKRAGADPKASLLDEYVRLLAGIQPRAFVMENVYGLAYRNQNRAVLNRFLAGVRQAGYAVEYCILLAADFGVPQLRQRMFCVGMRSDILDIPPDFWRFTWPAPTHSGPHETRTGWDESLPTHVTTGQALHGLEHNPNEPEERSTERMPRSCAACRPARTTCSGPTSEAIRRRVSSGDRATGAFSSNYRRTGRLQRFKVSPAHGSVHSIGIPAACGLASSSA